MKTANAIVRTLLGQQEIPEEIILRVKKFIQDYAQECCMKQRVECANEVHRWFEKQFKEEHNINGFVIDRNEVLDLMEDVIDTLEPYFD